MKPDPPSNVGTYATPHESKLLDLARGGDARAIETLLTELLPGIHVVCRRMCRDPGDAQDAAQNALMAVARGLPAFDSRSRLSTWVYRIATNACIDELRRRRRRPEPVDAAVSERSAPMPATGPGSDPEAESLLTEQRSALAEALDSLPEDYRVAVVLRDVADLEYSSISEITGVPIGTVRSRIARGRARLADQLGAAGTESPRRTSDPSEHP